MKNETTDNPHVYGKGTALSAAYTRGRDGKPLPNYIAKGTLAYDAWRRGALEYTSAMLRGQGRRTRT